MDELKRYEEVQATSGNLNDDEVRKNVYLFISTGEEVYHAKAVRLIKKRYGLTGDKAGNKIFWLIRNNLAKVIATDVGYEVEVGNE